MKLTGLTPSSFLEIPSFTCTFHGIGEKQQTRRDFGYKTTQYFTWRNILCYRKDIYVLIKTQQKVIGFIVPGYRFHFVPAMINGMPIKL